MIERACSVQLRLPSLRIKIAAGNYAQQWSWHRQKGCQELSCSPANDHLNSLDLHSQELGHADSTRDDDLSPILKEFSRLTLAVIAKGTCDKCRLKLRSYGRPHY